MPYECQDACRFGSVMLNIFYHIRRIYLEIFHNSCHCLTTKYKRLMYDLAEMTRKCLCPQIYGISAKKFSKYLKISAKIKRHSKNWGLEEAESGEDKRIQKWNRQSFQSPQWSTGLLTQATGLFIIIWDRATNNKRTLGGHYRWQDTVCMRYSFSKAHGSSLFLSAKQGSFYLAHSPLYTQTDQRHELGNRGKETRHSVPKTAWVVTPIPFIWGKIHKWGWRQKR